MDRQAAFRCCSALGTLLPSLPDWRLRRNGIITRNAGAWNNSGIRKELPDPLRDYLDGLEKPELKEKLRLMSGLNDEYGYRAAVDAMTMSLKNGDVNSSDATIIAQRITGYGIDTPPESGPSLEVYDRAFLGPGREDEAS